MSGFVIDLDPVPALPVEGMDAVFPVRRILCVGRNYAAHAREMGHDPSREPPFFFTKPADSLVPPGMPVPYPTETSDLHHEVEMVVGLAKGGRDIAVEDALDHVYGYAVGVDLTRRDMQGEFKKLGRPWDMAKGFDAAAPVGMMRRASEVGHPSKGAVKLSVNGSGRQDGDLADMIWPVPDLIAKLSTLITLRAGDIIFTGTPEGVAALQKGDSVEATVEGLIPLTFKVV